MKQQERRRAYFSGLIRLQRAEEEGRGVWRCSLELPGSGEKLWFADLGGLVAYLEAQAPAEEDDEALRDR